MTPQHLRDSEEMGGATPDDILHMGIRQPFRHKGKCRNFVAALAALDAAYGLKACFSIPRSCYGAPTPCRKLIGQKLE